VPRHWVDTDILCCDISVEEVTDNCLAVCVAGKHVRQFGSDLLGVWVIVDAVNAEFHCVLGNPALSSALCENTTQQFGRLKIHLDPWVGIVFAEI